MIADQLRGVAAANADRLAIIDGDQRITYAELVERVQTAREWLRETLHPERGGVIAVSMENSWQLIACFFAVSDLGCILTLCNPQLRATELRSLATRLNLRGAIVAAHVRSEWLQLADLIPEAQVVSADEIPEQSRCFALARPAIGDDAPAVYFATSGSTGMPRLVPRSHRNLIANAENVRDTLGITPERRFLSVVPYHFANGINNSLFLPLFSGATIAILRRYSPSACADLVHREKLDTLIGSPFIYGSLVDSVRDPALLASLTSCFSTGGRISSGLVERWRDRFGVTIRQTYGLSEAGVIAAELPVSASASCYGQRIREVDIAILGADGVRLEHGQVGEVIIRSPGLMSGYLGEPELTRARFHNGYFRTGDLGYIDSGGDLHLTGRIGRVLNLAGVKVDPVEVERTVELLDSVASCHVDTVPNGAGGDVIRARVVPRQGFQITRRDIIEQCRSQLAEYKFPRVIEFLEESPVSLGGKMSHGVAAP